MLPVGDIHIGCKKAEDNKDVEEFDTFDEPVVADADDEHAVAETVQEPAAAAEAEYVYFATYKTNVNKDLIEICKQTADQKCKQRIVIIVLV